MRRSSLFVLAAIAVLPFATDAVVNAAPSSSQTIGAVVLSANAADDGCDPLPPSSVSTGALGEEIYHFDIPGADDTIQIIPPPSIDITSASDEELMELGLPPRPTDPEQEAQWVQNVKGMTFAPAGMCRPRSDLPDATITLNASNRVFTVQAGDCSNNKGETSWVGVLSSSPGGALLQAGTYRENLRNSGLPAIFYENISTTVTNGPQFPSGLAVHQGDLVNYSVDYFPPDVTNSGKPEANYYWDNLTTGQGTGVDSILSPSQIWWDGGYADFIDEKFGGFNLQRYGSIGWTGAHVNGYAGGDFPGNLPHFFYQTYNSGLDQNLDLGLVSSSSWNDYWHGCN